MLDNLPKMTPTENIILIDWLTVTFHDIHLEDVKVLLGLDAPDIDWRDEQTFRNGYPRQCSFASINIRHGADKVENYQSDNNKTASEKVRFDMGICLDLSGNGCRAFETYGHGDWLKLLKDICSLDARVNITRLDLAYDDHAGILDLYRIAGDVRDRNFTGSPKKTQIIWSDDQNDDIQGLTVYVGSHKSPVMIRFYDKAAERGFDQSRHWVRVELQLRHGRAVAAIAEILLHNNVGLVFSGIMKNYCCFRTESQDSNKSRWSIADYWLDLIGNVEKIRLFISPGEPYNFRKTEESMIMQYGQAIQAFVEIHGSVHELLLLSRQAHPSMKKKYRMAIDQAKLEAKLELDRLRMLRKNLGLVYSDEFPIIPGQIDMAEIFPNDDF